VELVVAKLRVPKIEDKVAGRALKELAESYTDSTDKLQKDTALTEVEVNLGSTPALTQKVTVKDARVTSLSKILVFQSGRGRTVDEVEMSPIAAVAVPTLGSFVLVATGLQGMISGFHRFNYVVA
jgi:hypothetical protein